MDTSRMLAITGTIISAASLAIGIWSLEGVMIAISLFSFCFSLAAVKYAPSSVDRIVLITSVVVMICTALVATVVSYDSLVGSGTISKNVWTYMIAVLQTIPILPLIFLSYVAIASAFNASYNWAVVTGLSVFIGIGIQSSGYVLVYVVQWLGLGAFAIVNADVLYSLGIVLMASILFSAVLWRVFVKNQYLINSQGLIHRENAKPAEAEPSLENMMLTPAEDIRQRHVAWAMLIGCPASMMVVFAIVTAGLAPGLDAGHPVEYLQATCILWAIITTVLPILRLTRLVALPYWFVFLVYCNMYLYVLSLCGGLYLNLTWWGDFSHIVSGLIVAGFVFIALCLMQAHSPSHVTFGSMGGILLMLFLVAMSFGGIWEMLEGFTDAVGGKPYMIYGATDTVADMAADMTGVFIMTALAYLILNKQSMEKVASTVRFGRKAFEIADPNADCIAGN